jgi:hypothetical protein
VTSDVPHLRAILGAALGMAGTAGALITIPGLWLEVADSAAGRGTRLADHLEVAAADVATAGVAGLASPVDLAPPSIARLVALGWATVDLDRAAAAWPSLRWAGVPRDALVGARAQLGEPVPVAEGRTAWHPGYRLLLLEPDTEGRIAAALARHGEGPAGLYVALPAAAIAAARPRLARLGVRVVRGAGPFGPAVALAGPPPSGPTLVLLRLAGPATDGGRAGMGRGTIRP